MGQPPFRKGAVISLPLHGNAEFFSLQGGKQFLFWMPPQLFDLQLWFGGEDEHSFLVRLEPYLFDVFMRGGEEAFYASLKPDAVKGVEEEFGTTAVRQGDIWAAPIPLGWDNVDEFPFMKKGCEQCCKAPRTVRGESVFGTRHRLSGKLIYSGHGGPVHPTPFAEGTLSSPSHKSLRLEGPHLLAQTGHKVSGSWARSAP